MNRLWGIVNFILGAILLFTLFINFIFYRDSILEKYFLKAEEENLSINFKPEISKKEEYKSEDNLTDKDSTLNDTEFFVEEETEIDDKIIELEDNISSSFLKIKEGIVSYPTVVFKVYGTKEGTSIHLITFFPMEWRFIKTFFKNKTLLEPDRVYLCNGGIVDVNYVVKEFWPPEIQKGDLGKWGILAIPREEGGFGFVFDKYNGQCEENGFVFNLKGELAGVCFGDKFINYNEIYSKIPNECQLIYEKGIKGNGNLQGENR